MRQTLNASRVHARFCHMVGITLYRVSIGSVYSSMEMVRQRVEIVRLKCRTKSTRRLAIESVSIASVIGKMFPTFVDDSLRVWALIRVKLLSSPSHGNLRLANDLFKDRNCRPGLDFVRIQALFPISLLNRYC